MELVILIIVAFIGVTVYWAVANLFDDKKTDTCYYRFYKKPPEIKQPQYEIVSETVELPFYLRNVTINMKDGQQYIYTVPCDNKVDYKMHSSITGEVNSNWDGNTISTHITLPEPKPYTPSLYFYENIPQLGSSDIRFTFNDIYHQFHSSYIDCIKVSTEKVGTQKVVNSVLRKIRG